MCLGAYFFKCEYCCSERFAWASTRLECHTSVTAELDVGVGPMLEQLDRRVLLPGVGHFTVSSAFSVLSLGFCVASAEAHLLADSGLVCTW